MSTIIDYFSGINKFDVQQMLNDFNFTISIFQIFGIISIFVAGYFTIYLLRLKSENKAANRYLSLFFFLFVFVQLFLLFSDFKMNNAAYLLLIFFVPTSLAIAPTAYLYLKKITLHNYVNIRKHYYLTTIVLLINLIIFSVVYSSVNKDIKLSFVSVLTYTNVGGLTVIFLVQNFYYIYKSFLLLKAHSKNIENIYSFSSSQISLKWIRVFIFGYIGFLFITIVSHFVPKEIDSFFLDVMILGYLIYIGYRGSKQSEIFFGFEQLKNAILENEKETKKVVAIVNIENNQEIQEKLLNYLKTEKPYLNPELNIIDLAKTIGTNQKYLSQIINTEFEMNFINFINKYRIDEVLKLMKDSTSVNYTIETLGEMAGFKSKSSFYNAFKKITNETPSVYFKKING
ncbi:MAG TPA: hypothetical protein DDX39_03905 [Bacteroidales bacterium]|nr:MAG: hypothetical protein A2W98_09065 [Bacteroidetes bacterium GWF2_33_38]OFY88483.1 MAG: hypothetical protein A2236_10670 [Bacteroidetes bacterium RIFOXYA2_FULL_33_7]HBF87765.1 hypothetical protein [Bacteroidales bacterium]